MRITSMADLTAYLGLEKKAGIDAVSRAIYKATPCGAYVAKASGTQGVVVGSIVEGIDRGTQEHELLFPFDSS